MQTLSPAQIYAARAQRQHLSTQGTSDADYLQILRDLAPMRPPCYEFPGTPVCLWDRHQPSDGSSVQAVAERVRRNGLVFKARFQHGNVAYVPTDEMPLFMAAFRKPSQGLGWDEQAAFESLKREGPLQKRDLAEVCGIKGKALTKALQRLQLSFLVFEQQLETEWDNPWCAYETEHPDWLEDMPDQTEARLEVLARFTRAYVFSSLHEARGWSGFPRKEVHALLERLVSRGALRKAEVTGWGEGYLSGDFEPVPLEPCLAILDPGDQLVTAKIEHLKASWPKRPVLKYVLINGQICGLVEGRWGIGPFDVDDVHVPEAAQSGAWRLEVIAKLRRHFPLPKQRILKFAGEPLDLA